MLQRMVSGVLIALLMVTTLAAQDQVHVLFDFNQQDSAKPWRTVNDGVMGGRSNGQFKIGSDSNQPGQKHLEFFGRLSLENNGGFASVRAKAGNLKLAQGESVLLRVRGDGRKYEFNLYTQKNLGGYSYRQSFQTRKDQWVEVQLPLNRFVATWRGRTFPKEQLDPAKVAGVGILLGDKQPGPFKLEVDWIKAVKRKEKQ